MTNSPGQTLYLQRVDPERNMARFYVLALQPTLFGEVSLIRNWGRIGTGGQTKVETFPTSRDVTAAYGRIERSKRRRGYGEPR
ncbi:MAG: WGR domain-containing protein [Rhizobiaceae bacterium]|nr:WGR domain-containing protein [Rhizobiaceae bacterium]